MMIEVNNLTDGISPPVSFNIKRGSVAVLKTASAFESDSILKMITGLNKPASGSVIIDNDEILSISYNERLAKFKNIGIIWRNGSIISNLKVWENIALPVTYHGIMEIADVEVLVRKYYGMMGKEDLDALMSGSPGALPMHERLLVSMVRTMIMAPQLVIYDNVFEGADYSWGDRLGAMLMDFHGANTGRTSVFVSSSSAEADHIESDITIDTRQVS